MGPLKEQLALLTTERALSSPRREMVSYCCKFKVHYKLSHSDLDLFPKNDLYVCINKENKLEKNALVIEDFKGLHRPAHVAHLPPGQMGQKEASK